MSFKVTSGIYNPLAAVGNLEKMYRVSGESGVTSTRIIPEVGWERPRESFRLGPRPIAKNKDGQEIWWNNYHATNPEYPQVPLFQLVKESVILENGNLKVLHPDAYLPQLELESTGFIKIDSFWDKYLKGTQSPPFTSLKNQEWWDNLAEIIGWVGKYIGRYQITVHDGPSHFPKPGEGWKKYLLSFKSCAEKRGIPPMAEGASMFSGGIVDPGMQRFHLIWMKDLIDFCKAMGVPFDLEPWNEQRFAADYTEEYMKGWLRWFNDSLRRCNLPAGTQIISNGWPSTEWLATISDKVSIHGHSRPEDIKSNYGIPNNKIVISCDGGYNGDGDADEKGRKGPSPAQLTAMVDKTESNGQEEIEFFCRGVEGQGKPIPIADGGGVQPNADAYNHEMETACVRAAGLPTYEFVEVCLMSGLRSGGDCPAKSEQKFIEGQGPIIVCDVHKIDTIVCKDTGEAPNSWCHKEWKKVSPKDLPLPTCPSKRPSWWLAFGPNAVLGFLGRLFGTWKKGEYDDPPKI
jgi:hypothetical protein